MHGTSYMFNVTKLYSQLTVGGAISRWVERYGRLMQLATYTAIGFQFTEYGFNYSEKM